MISRKKFLAYVRNKVAVGVLCSGMLNDRLVKTIPEIITPSVYFYKSTTSSLGFAISNEIMIDDLYNMTEVFKGSAIHKLKQDLTAQGEEDDGSY